MRLAAQIFISYQSRKNFLKSPSLNLNLVYIVLYGDVERPNKKNSSFRRISKSFERIKELFE